MRKAVLGAFLAVLSVVVLAGTRGVQQSNPDSVQGTGCLSLINPGFETGDLTGWTVDGTNDAPTVQSSVVHSGGYAAALGSFGPFPSYEPNGDSSFYQTVTIPAGSYTLSFWYWPYSMDILPDDWQAVYVEDTSGNILGTLMTTCDNSQDWIHRSYDLTPYAGQTVRIEFLVHQDGANDDTGMYLDDVTICPSSPVTCLSLANPGFETGDLTGWTVDGTNDAPTVQSSVVHSGSYAAALGNFDTVPGYEPTGDSSFYQTVTIPAGTYTLSFWYWPYSSDPQVDGYWQAVYVEDTSGNILGTLMTTSDDSEAWEQQIFDLSPYAGQTVRIEFLVHQDGFSDGTGMYLDDVAICGSPASAYDLSFQDDYGRSDLCVNSTTGAWQYTVLKGNGAGKSFSGPGTIVKGSGYLRLEAAPGSDFGLTLIDYTTAHRATATFTYRPDAVSSALYDQDTTNAQPCGGRPPSPP